jgi:nitronate monooxygenase
VLGSMPIDELLPVVCELAGEVPVIAAGGISTAADAAHMRQLGASGVLAGTRFVATDESDAHPLYKQLLLEAGGSDTVRTKLFDGSWPNAPHRVLRNSTYAMWEDAGCPAAGARPGASDITMHNATLGIDVPRYHAMLPSSDCTGDVEAAALYAGMGVGKVTGTVSAAEVVAELAKGYL